MQVEPATASHANFRKWLHRLLPVLGILLFVVAVWTLRHQLKKHSLDDVRAALEEIPLRSILWAFVFTLVGYISLTGYDYLAMRYVNHKLQYHRVALAAFIGYAFSNSIGHSYLTGGTVRYRLYSVWGVGGLDIAKVIAFGHVAFYLGMLLLIGQGCIFDPRPVAAETTIPEIWVQAIGVAMLALVTWYFIWTMRRRLPVRIKMLHFPMPSFGLSMAQLLIATADMILMASVLYVLLPGDKPISFAGFVCVFMIAQVIGLGSQVPGGLGVFETAMLHVLQPQLEAPAILAALLMFRIIFFLIPLLLAVTLLGGYEIRHHHRLIFAGRRKKAAGGDGVGV